MVQHLDIDAVNNRIGVGKTSPAQPLDVVGNLAFSGALMPNAAAGTAGQLLSSAGAGVAPTWLTLTAANTPNIYSADGSIAANRTVSMGTSTLAFTSTATTGTNHFTVDGTTLNVNAVNNRVGIGTSTPSSQLTVQSLLTTGSNSSNEYLTELSSNSSPLLSAQSAPALRFTLPTNSLSETPGTYRTGVIEFGVKSFGNYSSTTPRITASQTYGVSPGNANLSFSVGLGTAGLTITNANAAISRQRAGISTTTPNSTLSVNGSISVATTRATASATAITLGDDDAILHVVGTVAQSITLPAANTCAGRQYIIAYHSTVAGTTSIAYRTANGTTSTALAADTRYVLVSDGTEWFRAN